jgi:hypothetical protein
MSRALLSVAFVAAASLGAISCGEEAPTPRLPGWGTACVSGTYWGRGDYGDNLMHPGRACITCHSERRRGPRFTVAGTIYSEYREENDCNGFAGTPATRPEVEITDASGQPFYITANSAGNFYTTHQFQLPLRKVRVLGPNGRVAEMGGSPPHGDCNSCHTREGTITATGMSPGRVVLPP